MFLSGGCSTVRAVTVEYRRTYRLTPDGYRSRYGLPPAESLTAPGIAVAKAAEGRARYVADGGHAGLATAWGVTEHGLVDALTRQATALALRNGLEITVTGLATRLPLPSRAEEQAYRIALEAVHNAVKHADAASIHVVVTDIDDAVAITVTDNVCGFDPTPPRPGHLGLTSMRERAGQIGADLQISTSPGSGSAIRLTVPVSANDR